MQVETMQRGNRLPSHKCLFIFPVTRQDGQWLQQKLHCQGVAYNFWMTSGHIREIQNQLAKSCYQPGDVDQNNEVCKTPKVCRQVDDGDVSSPGWKLQEGLWWVQCLREIGRWDGGGGASLLDPRRGPRRTRGRGAVRKRIIIWDLKSGSEIRIWDQDVR